MHDSDFEGYRPYLFAIAYRMLGSAMDAEDIVQEAFLRYPAEAEAIRAPKAYLASIVTRLSINALGSARARREVEMRKGEVWMPEPVGTGMGTLLNEPETEVGRKETLSLAFLILLERLSPEERAVFLLRDVFDYDYTDIAAMVGKGEAACRQLMHRARAHMGEETPRQTASEEQQAALAHAFYAVMETGDVEPFMHLLAEDVGGWGNARTRTTAVFLQGRTAMAKAMRSAMGLVYGKVRMEPREVNGQPGVLLWQGSELIGVAVAGISDGKVRQLFYMTQPAKVRYLAGQAPDSVP